MHKATVTNKATCHHRSLTLLMYYQTPVALAQEAAALNLPNGLANKHFTTHREQSKSLHHACRMNC